MRTINFLAANSTESPWLTIATSALTAITGIVGAILGAFFGARLSEKAQNRRFQDGIRKEFVDSMVKTSSTLYVATRNYRRARDERERAELRQALEDQYRETRTDSDAIEARLTAYYVSDRPRLLWHRTMDLLEVAYLIITDGLTEDRMRRLAGDEHTGLETEELRNMRIVVTNYRETSSGAIHAVLREPLAPVTGR